MQTMDDLLRDVTPRPRAFARYAQFNPRLADRVQRRAVRLRGATILHINSTPKGGGVAELLQSQVALERDLGLRSRWLVIQPHPSFFLVTKKIHHLLQGGAGSFSSADKAIYDSESARLADALSRILARTPADLLLCHDPQPLRAVASLAAPRPRILRLHIDLQPRHAAIADWLCGYVQPFARIVVSRAAYTLPCFPPQHVVDIPPAIDPLAEKNRPIAKTTAHTILQRYGIDPHRPLVTQISRFDAWKDPLGVLKAFHRAKRSRPDIQLVLAGLAEAADDPGADEYAMKVRQAAKGDPDVHIFFDPKDLGSVSNALFISALDTVSDIIVQKSIREGFGLTVTEAMWKGRPVIGGNAGGIMLQIRNGKNGVLVKNVTETADAILLLLQKPTYAAKLGRAARASVARSFLFPRYLLQHLDMYSDVLQSQKIRRR